MSMKSLAFVLFCAAFLACVTGDVLVHRKTSRDPLARKFQRALIQMKNFPEGLPAKRIPLISRPMVQCGDTDCCPKHYHHCCESGTKCCDFTGRRYMTYSCN